MTLAGIVFLQFFTRYVLNDSVAWTEEIARYGLIWITFLGGIMVTRRNNHIAVVLAPNPLPAPAARFLLAVVDVLTLAFLALLSYFSVLIFERIREEKRAGRSVLTSVEAGYDHAMATIIDANVTHVVAALVMFNLGSGPVRGFALTLVIGVITSFFTAVIVARYIMALWLKIFRPKWIPI